jgi:hypothetical protein
MSSPVARTQIRLFWDLQENPGTTLRDAADRLKISYPAARMAHSRLRARQGCNTVTQFCPHCFKPTVMLSDVVRVCTSCGAELPYVNDRPRAPVGGYEYTLSSQWNHMLGTNPNGIKGYINELRKAPARGEETVLMVMGDTDWKHFGRKGEDDAFTKKVLESLFHKTESIGLPSPVYLTLDRLGVAARRLTKEHLKVVRRKKSELRALESTAMAEQIADRVLRDALPGLARGSE